MADLVPVRDDLRALSGYHSAQVDVDVRLNTNESPFAPPPEWLADYQQAVAELDWNRYPDRQATALRAGIAALHGVSPAAVFAANGSNEVLQTILLTYAGPGRTALVFEPTYQMHAQIARSTGATVAVAERSDVDFTLDVDVALAAIERHRPTVTFVCSPNNPTGIVEARADVEAIIAAAPGLVVIDEAYAQFAPWSGLELVAEDRAVVVTRTFSKTWSMAAARLGYAVGPTWLVEQLDKVVLPYHLDAAKQLAGVLALRHVDVMEQHVSAIVEERNRVSAALNGLSTAAVGVEVFPSGSNFVLFRLSGIDARLVWQRLVDRGVLVRDCSGWEHLEGCLRVTIGTPAENTRFLAALAAAVA